MTTRLAILGAGGFGREVFDVVDAINEEASTAGPVYDVLGFLDDGDPDPATLEPYGVGVIGGMSHLTEMPEDVQYVVGVGAPSVRRKLVEQALGRQAAVLIHPSVTIGRAVHIGAGSVLCAGVRITNNVALGDHTHVNLNVTIGHDAVLDDYVTLSPLVAVSGYVRLEDEVMVGTGVTINPGVTIGAGSVIGSGAAVLKDIPAGVTAVGVPAKVR